MNARPLDHSAFHAPFPRVLVCDPGKTAGWALMDVTEHVPIRLVYNAGEMPAWDYVDWVAETLKDSDTLVCEAFIITPKTAKLSQQTDALEMIGALRWLCRDRYARFDVSQKAGDAREFDPKGAKLKQLNMWPTSCDHAQMASRHLLLYCARYKLVDPRRLVLR